MLGATHRELLAFWAIKTIMVQQAIPAAARASTQTEYDDLYARRRPPRDAQLWLAASEDRHGGSTGPLSLTIDRPPSSPRELLGRLPVPRSRGLSDCGSWTLGYTGAPS